jgi:hypothetical protein
MDRRARREDRPSPSETIDSPTIWIADPSRQSPSLARVQPACVQPTRVRSAHVATPPVRTPRHDAVAGRRVRLSYAGGPCLQGTLPICGTDPAQPSLPGDAKAALFHVEHSGIQGSPRWPNASRNTRRPVRLEQWHRRARVSSPGSPSPTLHRARPSTQAAATPEDLASAVRCLRIAPSSATGPVGCRAKPGLDVRVGTPARRSHKRRHGPAPRPFRRTKDRRPPGAVPEPCLTPATWLLERDRLMRN